MSEGSKDAAILIAVSYQALMRALENDEERLFTDCTVMLLFAGYYVEASLNYILDTTGKDIKAFPVSANCSHGKSILGLYHKLSFFYNEFISNSRVSNWADLQRNIGEQLLDKTFPGYGALRDFRNDVSHGVINLSALDFEVAKSIRLQAKALVNHLYKVTEAKGYTIERLTTYKKAIAAINNPSRNKEDYMKTKKFKSVLELK
jgi:hypothetical protein